MQNLVFCQSFKIECKLNVKVKAKGHDHLLEIQLLKKSAPHNFIIARHRSSNNIFSCQLLKNQKS